MNYANPAFPQPYPHPHRSWSDDHVPANRQQRNSVAYGARSASFSASQPPPFPKWDNHPPPPPVPPLPPSLQPGFRNPPVAHSNRDLFFSDAPQRPAEPPRPWTTASSAGPSTSAHAVPAPLSGSIPVSVPPWLPFDHHTAPDHSSSAGPNPLVVPPHPRPRYSSPREPAAQSSESNRASSYIPSKNHRNGDSFPSLPPIVPPRPITAYGDMRSHNASSGRPKTAPTVPPKTLSSPTSPSSLKPAPLPPPPPVTKDSPLHSSKSHQVLEISQAPSAHARTPSSEDISRALALSLSDSQPVRGFDHIQEEEEEMLARALAESLTFSAGAAPGSQSRSSEGSSAQAHGFAQGIPSTSESPAARGARRASEGSETRSRRTPPSHQREEQALLRAKELADREAEAKRLHQEREAQERADQDASRKLMEEEAQKLAAERRERERRDEEMARREDEEQERAQREAREAQEHKDAEMARRLAETGDPLPVVAPASAPTLASGPAIQHASDGAPPGPPQYDDVVASAPNPRTSTRPSLGPGPVHSAPLPPTSYPQVKTGRATSAIAVNPSRPTERADFSRSSTVGGGAVAQASASGTQSNGQHARGAPPEARNPSQGSAPGPSRPNRSPAPRDSSVEPELFRGVSFGFEPPKTQLAPVQISELPACPPFPEVISLHRGPSPPFHIMASSWRHLMRLLAQLETRIEASVDTIARTKDEHHLRVVVQFAKLPFTANAWRTILHLSLDHPVPPNLFTGWKFTNGDTNTLPYSYSLNEVQPHLIASPTSQIYVIPISSTTPLPILPIALPNLALYLQSAMRDSRVRKVQNDPTNTMRRLGLIVKACYPEEVAGAEAEEKESGRGMGGLFKRVVGRGAKRRDTQGNEDVYDMVTPFRIDKYTTT